MKGYVVVDQQDTAWAMRYRWQINSSGYVSRGEWTGTRVQSVFMHRELLGLCVGDGLKGDHINRDKLDNRRSNLRALTDSQSAQNQPSSAGSTSRFRGVTWNKYRKKWVAQMRLNGQQMYFGGFESEEHAARVIRFVRLQLMPYAVD